MSTKFHRSQPHLLSVIRTRISTHPSRSHPKLLNIPAPGCNQQIPIVPGRCSGAKYLSLMSGVAEDVSLVSGSTTGVPWMLILELIIGLPLALWTWKCAMMIVFQRRIIYMPFFPPGSRTEELDPDDSRLKGLDFIKLTLPLRQNGPRLDGLMLSIPDCSRPPRGIIYYLQGNAGNTLARLPVFRELLITSSTQRPSNLIIFALSPRGYWSSAGPLPFPFTPFTPFTHRLNEDGVISDYLRGLEYLSIRSDLAGLPIWLLGHSLGAAAAVQLLRRTNKLWIGSNPIAGLILENPLPSIRSMVKTLYPSKWVPYHHLHPFVRDEWDTIQALEKSNQRQDALARIPLLVIQSEMDELVPPALTRSVYETAARVRSQHFSMNDIKTAYVIIPHALHDTGFLKPRYSLEIHDFLKATSDSSIKEQMQN